MLSEEQKVLDAGSITAQDAVLILQIIQRLTATGNIAGPELSAVGVLRDKMSEKFQNLFGLTFEQGIAQIQEKIRLAQENSQRANQQLNESSTIETSETGE